MTNTVHWQALPGWEAFWTRWAGRAAGCHEGWLIARMLNELQITAGMCS
jgi:hypothetical protein